MEEIHDGDKVDLFDLMREVRQWAKAYPIAVYNPPPSDDDLSTNGTCSYFKGAVSNGPATEGCIIGQAIVKNLFDDALQDVVLDMEYTYGGMGVEVIVEECIEYDWHDDEQERALEWLRVVQERQDNGDVWAVAVSSADEYMWEQHGVVWSNE